MKMNLIASNDEAISLLSDKNSLIDSSIQKIEIFKENYQLCAKILVKCRNKSDYNYVILHLKSCCKISLFISEEFDFYNVENIKLKKLDNAKYYISFDPSPLSGISSEDEDVFVFSEIDVCNVA